MKNTDEYLFAGIPTFMASPYVEVTEAQKYDVAVLGIPLDMGSSYRLGAKYAPRAIREASIMDRIATGTYVDLDSKQTITGSNVSICDVGDVNIWPGNAEKNIEEITKAVTEIRKTTFPLILGGDHSVSYSNFKSCVEALNSKKIGIIHFDAHLDTEDEYMPTLPRVWHGNPFRQLIEEGFLDGKRMVSIGPRGRISEAEYAYSKSKGITIYTSNEVRKIGIEKVMDMVKDLFSKDTDFVFVSLDMDCLDIAQAPGVSTPKYGGLDIADLMKAMIKLKEFNVIGMDLVEVNPKYDPSGITSIIANELLYNFLSFGYKNPKLK